MKWALRCLAFVVLILATLVELAPQRDTEPRTCASPAPILLDASATHLQPFQVLIFTGRRGFNHSSTAAAVSAIQLLGRSTGFSVFATAESRVFESKTLKAYAVVVFLNTNGNLLSSDQQRAFERYIRRGGGFVGIHSASGTEMEWRWYHRLLGAYLLDHPPIQYARLVEVASTPGGRRDSSEMWERSDEWYNFRSIPDSVTVLMAVDERSYRGGTMGAFHPVSWFHQFEGGRAWYTSMGHTTCGYSDSRFLTHLRDGIVYAAGGG
jgi:type 1 glutamine amidotransferase